MSHRPRLAIPLFVLCGLAFTGTLNAQAVTDEKPAAKKPEAAGYVRLQRDDKGQPTGLETAIVRFVPEKGAGGVTVDLIAAVHIGDKAYYKALNQQLEDYDVVLYELVAAPGTRIPKGGKREGENPIAFIQQVMKTMLQLESQTERIDYTKKHFLHADLSPEQMLEKMRERGDDPLTVALGVMADMLRQQNLREAKPPAKAPKPGKPQTEQDLISLILDPDGPVKMKRMLAESLGDPAAVNAGLGQTLNTILIADRNEAAMKVFQAELAKGRKKIAIFYGAAHMPDFEKRLTKDFGLKRQSEKWLTAWDLE
jgi:hypothetical protein